MKTKGKIVRIPFVKISGAGNDFILIDEANLSASVTGYSTLSKTLCERHRGVGADGLLVYKHRDDIGFEMDYYNADGSTGGMCGNGARCIAAYYFDVYGNGNKSVSFMAFGTVYKANIDGSEISVEMKDPTHLLTDISINVDGIEIGCHFIDTGAPHVVVYEEEMKKFYPGSNFDNFDLQYLGRGIRRHEAFRPLGTNVNFIRILSNGDITIRTYERGVENETLACGTGSIASAVVTAMKLKKEPPIKIHTKSNEVLIVSFSIGDNTKAITNVKLAGPWSYHFTGTIYSDTDFKSAGVRHLPEDIIDGLKSITLQ